jgi:putative copper resistance protein D
MGPIRMAPSFRVRRRPARLTTRQSVVPAPSAGAGGAISGGAISAGAAIAGGAIAAVAAWLASAGPALAHGAEAPPAPTAATLVLDWSFDPLLQIPLLLAAGAYLWAVGRVDALRPSNRVPRSRIAAFLGGIVAIEIALQSGIEAYDTALFSVHMVQHVLLMMVAAPLLVLGAPITLLLRVASHEQRRRYILPVLHSRVVRAISHPVVAWLLFAGVMWGTHFSAIFDESLGNPLIHDLEHLLYLGSALLFWWPAVGVDPTPWRMAYPARILYLFLQMPQNTFLALAIFSASAPLYPHYSTLARTWGPTPLADQQAAGAIMWVVGDLIFLVAILGVVYAWMRDEERREERREVRVAAGREAIRDREAVLAERLAREAQGSGVDR